MSVSVLTAKLRVVTPMFIGGAAQKRHDGIRPPSVKGALRFWWRAIRWAEYLDEAGGRQEAALRALHSREARLFGTAAGEKGAGQSRFLLRVDSEKPLRTEAPWPRERDFGSKYLGYGILEQERRAIQKNTAFELRCVFRERHEAERAELVDAIRAWSLFGGLGSRARRGFGSVAIEALDGEPLVHGSLTAYREAALQVLARTSAAAQHPPFTAFSAHSRFSVLGEGTDPLAVHNALGQRYKDYRKKEICPLPQRVAFGLPLKNEDEDSRRASPLLFHIHPLGQGSFAAVGIFLPAQFHHAARYRREDLDSLYQPVEAFLDLMEAS